MSNGLSLNDLGIGADDMRDIGVILGNIDLNQLTLDEVRAQFQAFRTLKANDAELKVKLKQLGAFIFANGIHESLKDSLKIDGGVTWKELKTYFDFKSSKKQTLVRWVVDIMSIITRINGSSEKNIIYKQASKWGLEKELEEISAEYRFFGSYFHQEISGVDRSRMIQFSKKVITLSGGGKST